MFCWNKELRRPLRVPEQVFQVSGVFFSSRISESTPVECTTSHLGVFWRLHTTPFIYYSHDNSDTYSKAHFLSPLHYHEEVQDPFFWAPSISSYSGKNKKETDYLYLGTFLRILQPSRNCSRCPDSLHTRIPRSAAPRHWSSICLWSLCRALRPSSGHTSDGKSWREVVPYLRREEQNGPKL